MKQLLSEKIACSYFFAVPSLAYGLFTSRLPDIMSLAELDNADIGSVLLFLGLATLVGLLASNLFISRYGARIITALSAATLSIGIIIASLSISFWQISFCCVITGLAVGLCDVGVNTLGIELEKRYNSLHLSFLHGISSIGGVVGALSGAFFAWLDAGPFFNSLLVLGVYLLFWGAALKNTPGGKGESIEGSFNAWKAIPVYVVILGLLSLVAHIIEGAAAEWGSVFLRYVKHAPEEEAALAFACYTGGMVMCRLYGDILRSKISDFRICFFGSLLGTAGMILALLANWTPLCLLGYLLTGLGLGPIVPILFSLAGKAPSLSPGRASAIISTFSYTGLLLFPPLLGYLAEEAGLEHALWTVTACCAIVAAGSFAIGRKNGEKGGRH